MMITIDPGMTGTGWAIWDNGRLQRYGVITPPKNFKWQDKCLCVVKQLRALGWTMEGRQEAYVEQPALMGGAKGDVTARSGGLVKLTLLVGMIMNELDAKGVEVRDWKGQLPKEVVEKRVRELLPKCKAKSHAIDAVGIGLYILGRF